MRYRFLLSFILALTCSSAPTLACKCVQPPPSIKTARELAEWTANGSEAIFEGRVESVELKWPLMEAKPGDLISTDLEQDPPLMLVSFDVSRSYRSTLGKNALIRTGTGAGDCGFEFEVGKRYLVYASVDESGQLSTGICSGTALLEESQANLAYLRGEPIISNNLRRNTPVPAGRVCGRLMRDGFDFTDSQVLLLRVGDKSRVPYDTVEPSSDGSFCATDVIPGKYHLAFMNGPEGSPTSFAFYPGVTNSLEATAVEVKSGEANPAMVFKVPPQLTFSVTGTVITSNRSALPAECQVVLLRADPSSLSLAYVQDVASNGFFDFPQVLPGKYWALVTVDSGTASNWLTRKLEVNVEVAVSRLSLELIAK